MVPDSPSAILSRAADLIRDTAMGANADEPVAVMSAGMARELEALLRVAAVEDEHPSPLEYGSASLSAFMTVTRALADRFVAVLGEKEEQ